MGEVLMNDQQDELLDPADFGLRVGPMDKFVAEMIQTDPELRAIRNEFLRNLANELATMKTSFQESNLKLLKERAHAMRGSAGNYGFTDLFNWATAIEQEIAREARPEVIADLMRQLQQFGPIHSKTANSAGKLA